MKKSYKWLLVIGWMVLIFAFSNQPAVISDEKSKYVIKLFEILGLNLNSIFGEFANFAVRKASHFIEYFILSILVFNSVYNGKNLKKAAVLSVAVVFIYACSDEFHQMFIPGRACRFTDVIIDTSGGALASLLLYKLRIKR